MLLTNVSVKNALTVFVLIFMIIIIGAFSYISMPRESAPDITIPIVIVNTMYFGVSPSDMETLVTNPIEKELKNLEDVKKITSTSADSISSIVIEFTTDTDIDDAIDKIKEKVDLVKPDLPDDAEEPSVIEINLSEIPIMVVNISGEYGLVKLKSVAEDLKDKIETVKGVLEVSLAGGLEREIQIIADLNKLKQHKISLNKITGAIQSENINIPGGTVKIGNTKYLIRIPGEIQKAKELENFVIDADRKTPIYLRDIAIVKDTFKEKSSYSRLNNKTSVSLSIQKRSGENLIAIANRINQIIETQKQSMPHSTEIALIADQSEDIKDMVDELENSIIISLLLVVLVLYIFMGLRNAFFVAIAIPLSMLMSFTILHLMNITLNMVVLFSLILALGMLVDNAIVIVENIYRFLETGYSKKEAAMKATGEVAWPVIASTATTIAVFFPIIYMPGIAGEFMKYIPICVIITISSSLFVALLINPVVCSVFMKKPNSSNDISMKKSTSFESSKLITRYQQVLEKAIKHTKTTLIITIIAFLSTIFIFSFVANPGFEFFPDVTPSKIYVNVNAPEGSTIEFTESITSSVEKILYNNSNIKRLITTVGSAGSDWGSGGSDNSSKARIIVEFNDEKEWTENPNETIKWIRDKIKDIPGAEIKIIKEEMGPPTGAAIGVKISGNDYQMLNKYADQIKNIMNNIGGIVDITDDYLKGSPEIVVDIDRDKAALLQANTAMIASTIRTAIHGSEVSVFREGTEEYDVTLQLSEEKRNDINSIKELVISAKEGIQIPLMEVAKIYTKSGVGSISHLNSDRVVTIEAAPAEGRNANERLKALSVELNKIDLPAGYNIDFVGESEDQEEMAQYLLKAFFIAILLIAIILITQFNSILLPFIIMCSILLSLMGILMGLVIFQQPFGIVMTGIGIISLAGVIVNNAIVLIDYINQLRKTGIDKYTAVIKAGTIRLRPVLLTAITTILGLVPMTFGVNFNFKNFLGRLFSMNIFSNLADAVVIGGQNTEFWRSMGSAVTIGLATGTVLTLIVVPVLYITLDNLREKFI